MFILFTIVLDKNFIATLLDRIESEPKGEGVGSIKWMLKNDKIVAVGLLQILSLYNDRSCAQKFNGNRRILADFVIMRLDTRISLKRKNLAKQYITWTTLRNTTVTKSFP